MVTLINGERELGDKWCLGNQVINGDGVLVLDVLISSPEISVAGGWCPGNGITGYCNECSVPWKGLGDGEEEVRGCWVCGIHMRKLV